LLFFLIHTVRSPRHVPLFFLTDPPTSAIYTLSLHDALPISLLADGWHMSSHALALGLALAAYAAARRYAGHPRFAFGTWKIAGEDRKSTRLNSSHVKISYAVFCLKKKKTN